MELDESEAEFIGIGIPETTEALVSVAELFPIPIPCVWDEVVPEAEIMSLVDAFQEVIMPVGKVISVREVFGSTESDESVVVELFRKSPSVTGILFVVKGVSEFDGFGVMVASISVLASAIGSSEAVAKEESVSRKFEGSAVLMGRSVGKISDAMAILVSPINVEDGKVWPDEDILSAITRAEHKKARATALRPRRAFMVE